MKNKVIVFLMIVSIGNGFSQNQLQQQFSNIGLTNQSVMQQQRNTVFASNVANTNKQQRQTVQRQASQQIINQNLNPIVQNLNVDMRMQSNAAETIWVMRWGIFSKYKCSKLRLLRHLKCSSETETL